MRGRWFTFDARKRGPELFEQSTLITSNSRAARTSASEVAQVDQELPAEAATCVGWGLREKNCKQNNRDRNAYEDSKRRVKEPHSIVNHDIVDIRCEHEVHGRQEAKRADARLCHYETASQHQRCERDRQRWKVDREL